MQAQAHSNEVSADRKSFYQKISARNLTPLWEVLHALVPKQPCTPIVPAFWKFDEVRRDVLESGTLISAREAERRVLILENPAARGQSRITQTLYAGLQLILPGEIAPAHRHTQSALRLVLEGEGAYTAVDGERTTMQRGDFIITPSRTWHDHGHPGKNPVIWLDGLDIPLVQFLDAGFMEKSGSDAQTPLRPEGDTQLRYGRNMLPVDFSQQSFEPTRMFVYPYAQARDALLGVSRTDIDPHFGYKLRYVNPATGASPMPTIAAFAQRLPAGFQTQPYRSTDGTIYVCLEGEGSTSVGEHYFEFSPNDIFVVPSWHELRLHARRDTVLFSFSDRPVQQVLGLWREEKS